MTKECLGSQLLKNITSLVMEHKLQQVIFNLEEAQLIISTKEANGEISDKKPTKDKEHMQNQNQIKTHSIKTKVHQGKLHWLDIIDKNT